MTTTFRSFAKINLHLQVMGRRDDGFHELETVFQTVDLSDEISFDLIPEGIQLTVSEGSAPTGEENLAFRAALLFCSRFAPHTGVRMGMKKRIPIGGGLGGGSSNAATVLLAMQRLLEYPASPENLVEMAALLGADVPYFLSGGTALGLGRGDRIQALEDLEEREVILVTPDLQISTADVFGALRLDDSVARPDKRGGEWLESLDWQGIEHGWNDLEKPVLERFEVMRDVYNALVVAGATVVRLSGTGATVFAFFEDPVDTSGLIMVLPAGSRVVQTRTLTRSSLDRLSVVR